VGVIETSAALVACLLVLSQIRTNQQDRHSKDHMRLHLTRRQPARQPEAIAAGFEGQRNPT
jgi:uncharacterized membrane protein